MGEMRGVRRVVTFCLLTAVLPTVLLVIPLYLRHSLYADVSYSVAESDVLEAVEGISTVFCQEQILKMNSTFRAFQLEQMPPLSHQKKHIQLKKSMILPDDTVEYWGFYLLAGSNISLFACSRYEGAGVLVVKGEKNLKTCQSMEAQHKNLKYQKGDQSRKLQKTDHFKENKESKLKEATPLHNNVEEVSTRVIEKLLNHSYSSRDQEELTKERKEYTTNNPKQNKTLDFKNVPLEATHNEHVQKLHKKPDKANNQAQGTEVTTSHINHTAGTDKNESNETIQHRKAVSLLRKRLQDADGDSDEGDDEGGHERLKRKIDLFTPSHILDAGVGHGGNANVTEQPGESSDSSFEESLRECYNGQELLSKDIKVTDHFYSNYSLKDCKVDTLPISSDGYYYFIFYSDNDNRQNPIHAHFDIFKTTYQHTNFTRGCINQTECKFPITFWSNEIVIVEVPTRDGIEHEDGDASILVSSCYPRMSIYAIFPVAVLFLILGCAFL